MGGGAASSPGVHSAVPVAGVGCLCYFVTSRSPSKFLETDCSHLAPVTNLKAPDSRSCKRPLSAEALLPAR